MDVIYFKKKNQKKKTPCEDLMWRDAGELYANAIQVGEKKSTTQHSMGGGSTWGKVNACILHLCNKKSIQIKYVNISPCMK